MSNRIRPIPLTFGVAVGSRPPYVELDASVAGDEVAQVARQRPFMVYRNLDLMMQADSVGVQGRRCGRWRRQRIDRGRLIGRCLPIQQLHEHQQLPGSG